MHIPFRNFQELWPHQVVALDFIRNSTKKIIALNAPTGSGKSLISQMCKPVLDLDYLTYTTVSKYLQHQLVEDFPEAELLKGRANYRCRLYPELLTANECSHSNDNPCIHRKRDCYYDMAKRKVLSHPYRILNLPYWLNEANYVGQFSNQEFVVVDEGDMLESVLTSLIALPISFGILKGLKLPMPQHKTKWEDYLRWADAVLPIIKRRMEFLEEDIDNENTGAIKRMARLTRLKQKVKIMREEVGEGWLMSEDSRGVEFKPLWLDKKLVEKYFLQHSERFLLMSATLPSRPVLSGLLSIDQSDIDYLEVPSTFPLENRLIHYDPVVDLSKDRMEQELPRLISKIREIIDSHPQERILIHSVSYKLARAIYEGVDSGRCIIHDATNKDEMVGQYLQQDGAVIISPSLERGVDFFDDRCLPPETLVRTLKGYKPIESIKIGDRVWTHKRRFMRVTNIFKRQYNGEMIVIQPYGAPPQMLTPEHPILINRWGKVHGFYNGTYWINHPRAKRVSLQWKQAKDLLITDRLVLPLGTRKMAFKPLSAAFATFHRSHGIRKQRRNNPQVKQKWNDTTDFWELVGIWAAEGSITKHKARRKSSGGNARLHWQVQFSFGATEIDTLAERTSTLIKSVLGNKKPVPRIYNSGCVISIKNNAFSRWLKRNVGTGASNKRVPTRLLFSKDKEKMEAFLFGYIAGDGWTNGNRISCASVSRDLALGIRDMALLCGYRAQIHYYEANSSLSSAVRGKYSYWKVEWQKEMRSQRAIITRGNRYLYAVPQKIEKCKYTGLVYNLEIEKDESYSLIGICVHNCRVVIWAKIPYLNLGDKFVSQRLYSSSFGRMWYKHQAIHTIVQGTGRAMRHENDWCESWILDRQFERLMKDAGLAPNWFREAVVWK